jgi:AcrR family transcriptional regulator
MKYEILESQPKASRDGKRETILKIAYEAFLDEGYAATSMSSIAAKLGGSKATLYNYFASKEDLFIAVIDEKCQDVQHLLFETDFEQETFEATLKGLGQRFLTLLMSDDKIAIYRLITESTSHFPEIGRAFYQAGPAQGKKRLSDFFAQAVAEGKLRPGDTDIMASHFFDLCEGDIHRRRLWNVIGGASEAEIQTCVAHAVRVFLAAYGAQDTA